MNSGSLEQIQELGESVELPHYQQQQTNHSKSSFLGIEIQDSLSPKSEIFIQDNQKVARLTKGFCFGLGTTELYPNSAVSQRENTFLASIDNIDLEIAREIQQKEQNRIFERLCRIFTGISPSLLLKIGYTFLSQSLIKGQTLGADPLQANTQPAT